MLTSPEVSDTLERLYAVVLPLNRWVHIVCTTVLVGGTLFYEFVIPKAIEDLKDETQLAVLGRVRWVFRNIVVLSALLLLISGIVSTWRQWPDYTGKMSAAKPWWGLHAILGVVAMGIAVRLTIGDRVPRHPIAWLRVNFVILLLTIFAASVARYIGLTLQEYHERYIVPSEIMQMMEGRDVPQIGPTTIPAAPAAVPPITQP